MNVFKDAQCMLYYILKSLKSLFTFYIIFYYKIHALSFSYKNHMLTTDLDVV